MKFRIWLVVLLTINTTASVFSQNPDNYVSVHLLNQTFKKGQTFSIETDNYAIKEKSILIVCGTQPKEHIKISNKLGEIKLYFPKENTVSIQQNKMFSSENDLLFYFLNNNFYDLGLSKEGFTISGTHYDGEHQVITWKPQNKTINIKKVDLVFLNNKPIYAEYINNQDMVVRKVYYYDYQIFNSFILPRKITQITYETSGDSVVQRNTYSNIKTAAESFSPYFDFKIPKDAKILQ